MAYSSVMIPVRAIVLMLCALAALAGAFGLFGCAAAPTIAPEGDVVPTPPADEEMCRERFRPNLCPEVFPWV